MGIIRAVMCGAAVLLLVLLTACGTWGEHEQLQVSEPETVRTVVDSYGRAVAVPKEVRSVVCVGSGALRILSYLQCTDRLVGVEEADQNNNNSTLRDYAYVFEAHFSELPAIGKGGGTANTAYAEELIRLEPDVILAGYSEEALEELERITGIPCVSVRYVSTGFIDESFYMAMRVAAQALGAQERCEEVLDYIDSCKSDLQLRCTASAGRDGPAVYAGAVTYAGTHGFTGTCAEFGPFLAVGANNVADAAREEDYYDADPEQVLSWDPEIIFLESGNVHLVNSEYQTNPGYFHALEAVQKGQVYAILSFNNYSTNVGYALADAYYVGQIIFPDHFSDLNIVEKTDEILNALLGCPYYEEMVELGNAFGAVEIGYAS